ncbi:hypothetical protein L2K70_05820 [Nocardioides KLBMP 9356]|uniref:Alkaline shock response membrane anchor protein AmaP n=1 Tax=Nocardioides potassii TaxID=2911371 RepID=A0ABS9H7B2_9ACTN|nr:hypothetical protein [Nocardioides potassii]MCF6377111.1 hypothetical protein [Nocardioides potassii]
MSTTRTERALSRPPMGMPRTVPVGIVLALALVVLGVVAVRDLVVHQGWATGQPWLPDLLGSLDGLTPTTGVLVAATVAAVVGLALLLVGLLPAPRRHTRAQDSDQLWSSPEAVAAVARVAADRAPGVLSARAGRVGRRRIVLEIATRGDEGAALAVSREAATAAGSALGARRIDVRTAEEE